MTNNNDLIYIKVFRCLDNEIVRMQLEEVVKMVVAAEAYASFELEFLKVQAIIARTQLVKKMKIFGGTGCSKHKGCDICDEGHCIDIFNKEELKDIWKDKYNEYTQKISKAVELTRNLVITINNKLIDAKFHDTCGGATSNSENVIGNKVTYLRKVLCDYCMNSPNWEGYKEFTIKELEEKLDIKFPKVKSIDNGDIKGFIQRIHRDEQGRVISIEIGDKKFKGDDIKKLLKLDSAKFSVSPMTIKFETRGRGHGLGVCQRGGNQMVKDGYSYEDVIKYYYTGVGITEIKKPCIEKPLKGKTIMIDPGHGGELSQDVVGPTGLREKDVVLKIGKKLTDKLKGLGAEVILTRDKDEYISLNRRVKLANKIRPSFFLSIHLNSFSHPSIQGCEIYYYKKDKESKELGNFIIKSINEKVNIVNRGIRTADFFILREIGVNCIVVEVDYITNPEQEEKLKQDYYIDNIAEAITEGIIDYYHL